jgi:hypothetical protein
MAPFEDRSGGVTRMQDARCRIQDAGYRMQDTGCKMQDAYPMGGFFES